MRTQLTVKRQRDQLRQLTLTDGLTGLGNRRRFDEALEREFNPWLAAETRYEGSRAWLVGWAEPPAQG